ncbi:MAG: ABC transporter permease [Desulfurococcales archaeon]|nr:ABC transporter permease [Desulfurococcales archaeon]
MLIAKTATRTLSKRKLETIAIVLVIATAILGISSIKLAASYSIDLAGKAWVYELGSVVVAGDIPGNVVADISGLESVERVKLLEAVNAPGYFNGTPISVVLLHNPDGDAPASYRLEQGRRGFIVYTTGNKPLVMPGEHLMVQGLGDITVTGMAKGISVFMGGADVTIITEKQFLEMTGRKPVDFLLVVAPEADTGDLAAKIRSIIEAHGGSIQDITIQTEKDNPAARPMKSMANGIAVFISIALIAASLLVAGSEASLIERNIREIGVLKAVGVDYKGAVLYYAGHNILRGVIGVALGLIASIPVSKKLVEMGAHQAHGSEVMELLMRIYPFRVSWSVLGETAFIGLGLIITASLIPPLIAYKLPGGRALRFTGLTGRAGLQWMKGRLTLVYSIRRAASRPWLAAFLILFLAVTWGSTASIPMSTRGLSVVKDEIINYGYDARIVFAAGDEPLDSIVNMALKMSGVRQAEVWGFKWRAVRAGERDLAFESCVYGNWSLGPKLSYGHWPMERGEAVVSETVAEVLGVGVGDDLVVEGLNGTYTFTVVGVALDHNNNGMVMYVNKGDYLAVANTPYLYLYVDVEGNAKSVGSRVVDSLIEDGIPASGPYTKDKSIKAIDNTLDFMKIFLSIINGATLLVGITGLSVLLVVDLAGRLREIGVLRAIGFTNTQIVLSEIALVAFTAVIAAPLSYLSGLIISSSMLRLMIDALGYVRPRPALGDVASASWILIPSLLATFLIGLLYLRRQSTGRLLRIEL